MVPYEEAIGHKRLLKRYFVCLFNNYSVNLLLLKGKANSMKTQTKPQRETFFQRIKSVTTIRILFGCIWVIDALFKWQPGFQKGYLDILVNAAKDQPLFLKPWFDFWIGTVSSNTQFFIYATALTESYIALAVLFGFARKFTYTIAILFSLLIWSTAEGFGGAYTAGSTDIGAAIMYALVAFALLVSDRKNK